MVKMSKKAWIITGVLAGVSIFAAIGYMQVMKALKYAFKFTRISDFKVSTSSISLRVYVQLTNPSKILYTIDSLTSKIYVNGIFLTTIKNDVAQTIVPGSSNEYGVDIMLDLNEISKALKGNVMTILTAPELLMKVETDVKVSYKGIISVHTPIEETYDLKKMVKGMVKKK